ncbi:hypothetical protein BJ742DRAFT_261793 [Cladochytrium replicatum]|nr:hypothetical protein BJ742DRAFT_261793 [Cladochytrium replicatum]
MSFLNKDWNVRDRPNLTIDTRPEFVAHFAHLSYLPGVECCQQPCPDHKREDEHQHTWLQRQRCGGTMWDRIPMLPCGLRLELCKSKKWNRRRNICGNRGMVDHDRVRVFFPGHHRLTLIDKNAKPTDFFHTLEAVSHYPVRWLEDLSPGLYNACFLCTELH